MEAEYIAMIPMAARTASANTSSFRMAQNYLEATLYLTITAVSGTSPTLQVFVDSYDETAGVYSPLGGFGNGNPFVQVTNSNPQSTGVLKLKSNLGRMVRIRYVINGVTPSFTFSVACVFKTP